MLHLSSRDKRATRSREETEYEADDDDTCSNRSMSTQTLVRLNPSIFIKASASPVKIASNFNIIKDEGKLAAATHSTILPSNRYVPTFAVRTQQHDTEISDNGPEVPADHILSKESYTKAMSALKKYHEFKTACKEEDAENVFQSKSFKKEDMPLNSLSITPSPHQSDMDPPRDDVPAILMVNGYETEQETETKSDIL